MSELEAIETLTRHLLARAIRPAQLRDAVSEARLTEVPPGVWEQVNSEIDCSPRRAHARAAVVKEIARRTANPRQYATANLLLIRALNALGEFREAIAHCEDTAQALLDSGDAQAAARVWLEAAWAQTYLGYLVSAREYLTRADDVLSLVPGEPSDVMAARTEWIEGRILREQGDFAEAAQKFEHAWEVFEAAGETLAAARCLRELGHTHSRTAAAQALPVLERARRIFEQANCRTEVALCDYFLAQACRDLNQFQNALDRLGARRIFSEEGQNFFVAWCDLDTGFVQWQLTHYDLALTLLQQARDYFLGCGAESEASSCDINIAGVLSDLNRYEEAVELLQHAAKLALASGRQKKAALCWMNIGWAYDKQGRYAHALEYYQRARDEFASEEMQGRLVMCDLNLGLTYLNLGQYEEALIALEGARKAAHAQNKQADLAECELYRAQALLALNQTDAALDALQQARAGFEHVHQEVYVAICDRLWAWASSERADKSAVLARLEQSRAVFASHGQPIDAALCDLTRGDLHLAWHEWKKAQDYLQRARRVLHPAFPDQAWRAAYGLGKVALAQKQEKKALKHHLDAVQTIATLRTGLGLEELSNDLFGARQQVFADSLALAQAAHEDAQALAVIEAAKAQTFLHYLMRRDWRVREDLTPEKDTMGADLTQRERELRYRLAELRQRVSIEAALGESEPLRGAEVLAAISAETLNELNALSRAYESVVARLRLTRHGLAGVPSLAPFSLKAFRTMARVRWGQRWAALDYYLSDGKLTVAYVDADTVKVETMCLSKYDHFVLRQCAGVQSDLRELVYRGSLHNTRVPTSGTKYLQYLASRLIPPRIREMLYRDSSRNGSAEKDERHELTLIISPHGLLHQLPFHALMDQGHYLLERFVCLCTPSLQALSQLNQNAARLSTDPQMLICGLNEFGPRAPSLPHTRQEIQAMQASAKGRGTALWETDATRRRLLELNEAGKLLDFDVLHFATHAIVEPRAPHWSRILLADEDLTVLDIMDLDLEARLVTLSACSSALGEGGRGDELLGLARAFFYAGACSIVASLWAVEDESTAELMRRFYRNLKTENCIGKALRTAQLEMRKAGYNPYQWAPFVVIGAG